ncbi:hypothetical protein T05_391 [Trichinella murrelli]|uniref:Uncharacterized protein n=1 Tax=Trichinella murrelli TaxID=144512 RepID=A0A0V0TEZ1_9BILA|nr:hypothetical protein T05_391 [Trichinella murrelli]
MRTVCELKFNHALDPDGLVVLENHCELNRVFVYCKQPTYHVHVSKKLANYEAFCKMNVLLSIIKDKNLLPDQQLNCVVPSEKIVMDVSCLLGSSKMLLKHEITNSSVSAEACNDNELAMQCSKRTSSLTLAIVHSSNFNGVMYNEKADQSTDRALDPGSLVHL